MTDTAKSNILKYLTGKIVPEPIVDEPQFLTPSEITNDLDTYLLEQFAEGFVINGTLQSTNSNITFLYGGFDNGISWQGFIIVCNYDLTPIQKITKYSTGTNLGIIHVLNVDENGLYYGVEKTTSQKFIMLNNIGVKNPQLGEYEVKLRKSYILPDELNLKNNYRVKKINKIFGQARYVFVAYNSNFTDGTDDLSVAELKINVGIENEWTYYSYETGKYDTRIKDSYVSAEEDDSLYFKVIVIEEGQYIEYTRNGISITKTAFTPTFTSSKSVDAILISKTESYVAVTELLVLAQTNKIYKVNYSGNTLTEIYNKETPFSGVQDNLTNIALYRINNEVFYMIISDTVGTSLVYDLYIGKIIGYNTHETQVDKISTSSLLSIFYVSKQYNLYTYYFQYSNKLYKTQQIYNILNYNGLPYEDYNLLIPQEAILYDTSDMPIYARNLYNLVVDDNSTVATIEIPNTLLNDVTIENKDLLSETNQTISQDTSLLVKNIYENVLINFYNNLYMKKGSIYNLNGAIKLNESFNENDQYDNAKITKYKLIYDDDTYDIRNIDTITITSGVADLEMYFYLNKELTKLQILSNDETTVYCESTITGINKFYKVNQKVEVI